MKNDDKEQTAEEYLQSVAPQLAVAIKQVHKYFEASLPTLNLLNKSLYQATRKINLAMQPLMGSFTQNLIRAAENMNALVKKTNHLKEELRRDDIFLTPYIDQKLSFKELIDLFSNTSKSPIEIYDSLLSSHENVADLLKSWEEIPEFQERIEILTEALNAHLEKRYILSIPLLLSQIEGLCIRKAGNNDIKSHFRKLKGELDLEYDVFASEIFYEAIVTKIFGNFSLNPELWNEKFPNRHLILHGKDITYYKKEFSSTRLILVLDFLTKIFTEIEESEDGR